MSLATTPSLLEFLLQDQQSLSAVDSFSNWHDSHSDDGIGQSNRYQALMPSESPLPGQQYAFDVDLDTCSGCKACVVACHNLNGLEESETWRKVGLLTSKASSLPIVQHVTTACHHCVDPGCLNGCPVLAYEKDPITGIVKHLDDQCFGCQYCTMMCPYEIPQYSATLGIVRKCDMCSQRMGRGEAPACVQACPNQAIRITIVDQESLRRNFQDDQNATLVATAPPSFITIPTTIYRTSHSTDSSLMPKPTSNGSSKVTAASEVVSSASFLSTEIQSDQPQHGHWPLASMLVLTQASVGMFLILVLSLAIESMTSSGDMAQANNDSLTWFYQAALATTVGIFGVHLALLHLGRPWLAFRAFLGWRRSWLSREAILFGVYMGAMGATCGLWFIEAFSAFANTLQFIPRIVSPALATAMTALVGVASAASSAMIYIATKRPLWSMVRTGWDFAWTTIGLGASGFAIFASVKIASLQLMAFALLCVTVSTLPSVMSWIAGGRKSIEWKNFSARSGRLLRGPLARIWMTQWFLVSLSLLSLVTNLFVSNHVASIIISGLFFAFLLASKLVHRWLYFASVVTYRMPGAGS